MENDLSTAAKIMISLVILSGLILSIYSIYSLMYNTSFMTIEKFQETLVASEDSSLTNVAYTSTGKAFSAPVVYTALAPLEDRILSLSIQVNGETYTTLDSLFKIAAFDVYVQYQKSGDYYSILITTTKP